MGNAFVKDDLDLVVADPLEVFWLFINGVLVFFMQCGFAMLEAGTVQHKNIKNILLKNLADVCAATIVFWLFGFALAYGGDGSFIGDKNYFGGECLADKYTSKGCGLGYADWFFQYAFAATAATIVSGAVAERTRLGCYVLYSCVLTGIVYPTVVHWVWGGGWLAEEGVHDFAGSGVVHMVGGCAAIVGATVIGPRHGRFTGPRFKVTTHKFQGSSIMFSILGTFILWTGWLGFNVGSTLNIAGNESVAGLVMVNTVVAPSAAGITALGITGLVSGLKRGFDNAELSPEPLLNGVLAGLVSITAGCDVMVPSSALVVGIVGGLVYLASSEMQKQLKIDDVLDAGPIHYFCGAWGVIAVGLFTTERYGSEVGGVSLGWQFVEVLSITAWSAACSFLVFGPMKCLGLARVSFLVEKIGLDEHHHGGMHRHVSVALEVIKQMEVMGKIPSEAEAPERSAVQPAEREEGVI